MPEERFCPRCGLLTATTLACEHCGYLFQTNAGDVEIRLPAKARRLPLRLNLRGLLITGGIVVLTMCLCPQPWLYAGELLDRTFEIKGGFITFGNATAAALLVCPLVYALILITAGIIAWRKQRGVNSPQ